MRLTFVSTGLNEWVAKLQRMCITKEYFSAAWLSETLVPLLHDAIELLTRGATTSSKASNLVHDMDFTCTYVVNTATEGEMIRRSDVRSVVLQQMRCALQELQRTYPDQLPKSSSSSMTNLMHSIRQPRCDGVQQYDWWSSQRHATATSPWSHVPRPASFLPGSASTQCWQPSCHACLHHPVVPCGCDSLAAVDKDARNMASTCKLCASLHKFCNQQWYAMAPTKISLGFSLVVAVSMCLVALQR